MCAEVHGVEPPAGEQLVEAGQARAASVRARVWLERMRNSLAVIPAVGLVGGWALARVLSSRELNDNLAGWIDDFYAEIGAPERSWVWFSAATFQTVTATVAAAMLTFIGVVFSLSILALQVASSQLSPRIMRTFVRSNVVTWTLAVFMATFVYALTVLSAIQPGTGEVAAFEPFIAYYALLGLVAATLAMFVAYVSHVVRLIRIHHILDAVAAETGRAVENTAQRVVARRVVAAPVLDTEPLDRLVAARSGVVDLVGVHRLGRLAEEHDCVLVVCARIGDHVSAGQVLVEVHGEGPDRPDPGRVLAQVDLGAERTLLEDPAFGLRQVVDVACRALSPAVNDPTTAVQAIDRLVDLLSHIGRVPDEPVHWLGPGADRVRVVVPARSWNDLVDLAFTEILGCGADAPQVVRRAAAALDDLVDILPDHRHEPLLGWRRRLEGAAAAVGGGPLWPDRSGLG